ncbi:MAG TPA: TolC family protein [Vicinamibacterales bacterium]|nr:TolC family protein [Vicinamibacterales bacterium]
MRCRSFLWISLIAGMTGINLEATMYAQTPAAPSGRAEWSLDDVLTVVLAEHPLVNAARAQLSAVEGKRQTARVLPNPVATFWMENARFPGQSSPTGLERETSAYATFPLEPFFQRSARTAEADGDVHAAQAAVTTAEQRTATEAVHAFYRVALAQASLDAATENRTAIDQLLEYLRNRVAQGATAEGELIRTEVERDRLETEVTLADVELLRAQSALRAFLGGAATAGPLRVAVPGWGGSRATLTPLTELTAHALAQRPELVASRARRDAASGALALERALVVRQLGATFGLKRTAGINAMIAGVSVTVPIFDRNHGEIQRATGEQLASEQESQWLERSITSEIDAEYLAAERLAGRVSALQPSYLARAEESRRIALAAYQEGATGLLQVLDASRALSDARLSYARALVAANESLFDLGVLAGYDAKTAARLGGGDR